MRREQGTLHGTALAFLVSLSVAFVGCSPTTGDGLVQAGDVVQVQADTGTQQAADALDSDLDETCVLPPGCVDPNADGDLFDAFPPDGVGKCVSWSVWAYKDELPERERRLHTDLVRSCRVMEHMVRLHCIGFSGFGGTTNIGGPSLEGIQCMPNLERFGHPWRELPYHPLDGPPKKPPKTAHEALPQLQATDRLGYLTKLMELDLTGWDVASLAPLGGLADLQSVEMGGPLDGDLTPLMNLKKLEVLHLRSDAVTHLNGMEAMGALRDFELIPVDEFSKVSSINIQPLIDKSWPCDSRLLESGCRLKLTNPPSEQVGAFKSKHPNVEVEVVIW